MINPSLIKANLQTINSKSIKRSGSFEFSLKVGSSQLLATLEAWLRSTYRIPSTYAFKVYSGELLKVTNVEADEKLTVFFFNSEVNIKVKDSELLMREELNRASQEAFEAWCSNKNFAEAEQVRKSKLIAQHERDQESRRFVARFHLQWELQSCACGPHTIYRDALKKDKFTHDTAIEFTLDRVYSK